MNGPVQDLRFASEHDLLRLHSEYTLAVFDDSQSIEEALVADHRLRAINHELYRRRIQV